MTLLNRYLSSQTIEKGNSAAIAYLAALDHLKTTAPEIANAIVQELKDQRSHLKLIASENYSSLAVQLSMGNLLTDKYAEGYAHHRFYAGCENVDTIEHRATEELKALFSAEAAYVQPHSGADANLVAFWSVLVHKIQTPEVEKLGKKRLEELTTEEYEQLRQLMMSQTLMGMSLNSGGHLTHGYLHNLSSKMFRSVSYDVDPQTGLLNYHQLTQQVKEVKPTILLAGYSAYPRKLNFAKMREIADSVGATLIVDMAHFSGLVAGKVMTGEYNPVPYADLVTSTTHKTLRGPRGGIVLCKKEFEEVVQKGCPLVLGGPLPHVMAAKAVAFQEANSSNFQNYAHQVVANAQALGEALKEHGIPLLTGGTENHMVILDISSFNITGRHAETALRQAGITVNRNAIPFDTNGPWYTSGIRVGTPAVTTLGMGVKEMEVIAQVIADVIKNTTPNLIERTGKLNKAKGSTDSEILKNGKKKVEELLQQYPLYPEIVDVHVG